MKNWILIGIIIILEFILGYYFDKTGGWIVVSAVGLTIFSPIWLSLIAKLWISSK